MIINFKTHTISPCIRTGSNFIDNNWEILDDSLRYFIITDDIVDGLYQDLIDTIPNLLGKYIIPNGETAKSMENYLQIIKELNDVSFHKNDCLIAIGGGVVTDLSGMVAGTYLRGVPYISIPTTLTGMVDASLGGKCGVNFKHLKNQIGMFYHPTEIFIDTMFLKTNALKEYQNGFSEIIKIGITSSSLLFDVLSHHDLSYYINNDEIIYLIDEAIKLKISYVELDEFDKAIRHTLNFGHTIGHIIESNSNFTISHGHAVALGMIAENNNEKINKIITEVLKKYQLLEIAIPHLDYVKLLNSDKKATKSTITMLDIIEIGQSKLKTYRKEELTNEQFWKEY